ncbi:hypothetical protein [Amycolatopsis pigmentata]|uniref:SnoaL-like domain-containing protein n=1 Tax=Amycolatopsis pigmentata TaxID=450801 RepID=A0ABW5G173_9PSEU
MTDAQIIADRCTDAYNEPDRAVLAEMVTSLWAPDGAHFGGFSAKGHDELVSGIIQMRVEKVEPINLVFRLGSKVYSHEDVIMFLWEAVTGSEPPVATGATVIKTTPDGRIQTDYSFTFVDDDPDQSQAQQLADGFADVFNEPDPEARAALVRKLWAPNGLHLGHFVAEGHQAITDGIAESYQQNNVEGQIRFQARRHAMRKGDAVFFLWDIVPLNSPDSSVAVGSEILFLDNDGRVTKDHTIMLEGD